MVTVGTCNGVKQLSEYLTEFIVHVHVDGGELEAVKEKNLFETHKVTGLSQVRQSYPKNISL